MGLAGYAAVQRSYALGVLWLVGFHCCLRSGEMFALRAGDIIFGQGSNYAVLNLRLTKTGARRGAQESVTISDSIVAAHLQRVVRDLPPGQLVCSLSGPSQRQIFHEVCRELQLDEHGYGMYSFRRGGATHDFSHHGRLDRTIVRGRWSNSRTARLYITEGLAALADLRLTPPQRRLLETAANFWHPG